MYIEGALLGKSRNIALTSFWLVVIGPIRGIQKDFKETF